MRFENQTRFLPGTSQNGISRPKNFRTREVKSLSLGILPLSYELPNVIFQVKLHWLNLLNLGLALGTLL